MRAATRHRAALLFLTLGPIAACTIRVMQPAPLAGAGQATAAPKPDTGKTDIPWKPYELDAYTRDHFADSRERIQQALNAQVVQPLGPTVPRSSR